MKTPYRLEGWSLGLFITIATSLGVSTGCYQWVTDEADRRVYHLIQERQRDALGLTAAANLGKEDASVPVPASAHEFAPHPMDSELPESFRAIKPPTRPDSTSSPAPAPKEAEDSTAPPPADSKEGSQSPDETPPAEPVFQDVHQTASRLDPNPFFVLTGARQTPPSDESLEAPSNQEGEEEEKPEAPTLASREFTDRIINERMDFDGPEAPLMTLNDVLLYANRHARQLQNAKEDLYLAGLDLALERHLWTPQFAAAVSAEFADYGEIRDFDRAMTSVAEFSVRQRLPLGGEVSARLISSLMRDLGTHVTSGETGNFIMQADIPLFRNAGRVAYESRYRAERELIYAVRAYERFRREFLVDVATSYFSLQSNKAGIANAIMSFKDLERNVEETRFRYSEIEGSPKEVDFLELARVESNFNAAASAVQDAKERYATAKDQFKIFLAMPIEQPMDIASQGEDKESQAIERLLPDVDLDEAIRVALRYRLDLLNDLDRIDDARRGVVVARNGILPDLDFTGSVTLDSDPGTLNSMSYDTDRTTWRGIIQLRMDDRMTERHALRESLITLNRSERAHEQASDEVQVDVRRAFRRLIQADNNREIQRLNVAQNERRFDAAETRYRLGRSTNQDLVDAQNDLLDARDRLASAEAGYRTAVLEFRLATGTLRLNDDGSFTTLHAPPQG